MRTVSLLFVAFFFSAFLSACGTVQIGERNFIQADKPDKPSAPRAQLAALVAGASVSEETLATPDGARLGGVLLKRPGARHVVLYFGGNQFHIDPHGSTVLPLIASCGADVAVFDYRGYGRSSGTPTVALMAADALRVFDHVNAQYPGAVIVHGQSLGSFMVGHVVQHRPGARAMVLEATATTVPDWVEANVPWYARLFARFEVEPSLRLVDNVGAVRRYTGPSLVLAGARDRITPPALARKVFDAIPAPSKRWYEAPGSGHNDTLGAPDVLPVYCGFIKTAGSF